MSDLTTEQQGEQFIGTLKRRFQFTRGYVCKELGIKTTRLSGLLTKLEDKGYIKRVNTDGYRPFVYRRIKDIPKIPEYNYKDHIEVLRMVTSAFWTPPPMRVDVDYYGSHAGSYWYKPLIHDIRNKHD